MKFRRINANWRPCLAIRCSRLPTLTEIWTTVPRRRP